ncbi:phage head closure protein [Paenibacillus sp. MAH-36]|uniref:Phage head closure protein n=1 Tax=Paenibacillus violae TaxID=3077234 RepID=A0ABU3R7B3_9BACL|nr:phage head closure protein [Paenibacillus sp. PFR10]MDU0200160.1 phage head closure protein [Paenibacillus sp. PFR10]
MLEVGKLDKRVDLWGNTTVKNEIGANSNKPGKIRSLWAQIENVAGGTSERAGVDTNKNTTTQRITVRYRKDITANNWIMFRGHRFEIDYVDDMYYRQDKLILHCREVKA